MKQLTVIDLFCGCGGFSLGFIMAGYRILVGLDNDKCAIATYWTNLCRKDSKFVGVKPDYLDKRKKHPFPGPGTGWIKHTKNKPVKAVILGSIEDWSGYDILKVAEADTVDVIIGSPPCPSFSLMGKRIIGDVRDFLLFEFLRVVMEIQPATFVMENVPGLISKKLSDGRKVMDVFLEISRNNDWDEYYRLESELKYGVKA